MRRRKGDKLAIWSIIVLILFAVVSILSIQTRDAYLSLKDMARLDKFSPQLYSYPIKSALANFYNSHIILGTPNQDFAVKANGENLIGISKVSPTKLSSWNSASFSFGTNTYEAKLKLKGISPSHWLGQTKSFKLKSKKSRLLPGMNRELAFDLVSHPGIVADQVAFEIADELELLIPQHHLWIGSVNLMFPRVFQVTGTIDEQLLRQLDLMPADIYRLHLTGYRKGDQWRPKIPFTDSLLWTKEAVYNHLPTANFEALEILLIALREATNSPKKEDALLSLFDEDYIAKFLLFLQLIQSTHMDNVHNVSIYFDPWRGKFFPIVEDAMAWHGPFGNTFEQFIPKKIQQPVNYLTSVSLQNDLFDTLKKIPRIQSRMITNWPEFQRSAKTKIDSINTRGEEILVRLNGGWPIEIGTSFYSQKELKVAIERLEEYSNNSLKIMEQIITDLEKSVKNESLKDQKTVYFSGNIKVEQDVDLRAQNVIVKPGTEFLLGPGTSVFFGNAALNGTAGSPIKFRRLINDKEFGAVVFENAALVTIEHIEISGGSGLKLGTRMYSGQLNFQNISRLSINHCKAGDSSTNFDDNLHLVYVDKFELKNCTIYNSPSDGIDIDISKGSILRLVVTSSGNDGLDLMSSDIEIHNSKFQNNGDKGLSVGERTKVHVTDSFFAKNSIGLEVKDASVAKLDTVSVFDQNKLDVNLYKKNWRFGGGGKLTLPSMSNITTKIDRHSIIQNN